MGTNAIFAERNRNICTVCHGESQGYVKIIYGVKKSNLIPKFPAACDSIIEVLNMEPLGGSEVPAAPTVHTLQLSGLVTGGGGKVLVRCRMTFSHGSGVTLELGVRAESQEVCDLVLAAVGG